VQVHRWTSTERTARERGLAFGRGLAPAIANTVDVYRRILREDVGLDDASIEARGNEVAEVVERFRPQLARELEGIAAGSGQPPALLFAVNARTELLRGGRLATGLGVGECSTVAVVSPDGDRAVLAQNWDFHVALAASRVVWATRREGAASFLGLTEAGILAKIGVNSHGVAIAVNFLSTDRDSGAGGVPLHVLFRVILEEARTLPEAVQLVTETPVTASICITVAGPDDDGSIGVVALGRWPDGVALRRPSGNPPHLVQTNHFVEPIAAVDLMSTGPNGPFTRSRYDQLTAALDRCARPDVPTVARQLSSVSCPAGGQSVFVRADDRLPWLQHVGTLATVAVELPSGRFWLRDELDADAPLELVGAVDGSASAAHGPQGQD
jgi:isopenicillin-N N-acyltransferase-like protein